MTLHTCKLVVGSSVNLTVFVGEGLVGNSVGMTLIAHIQSITYYVLLHVFKVYRSLLVKKHVKPGSQYDAGTSVAS